MRLWNWQLALDFISIEDSIELLKGGRQHDIIEIGTPFIVKDGMRAAREVRAPSPSLVNTADLKTGRGLVRPSAPWRRARI